MTPEPVSEPDPVPAARLHKLCLLILHTGATDLAECATPLLHALTANAMECEVEIYFIGASVRLLAGDTAASVLAGHPRKPLAALLEEAQASGVRIYACTSAWKTHLAPTAKLARGCAGFAGAATYLGRAMDPEWRILSY